MNPSASGWIKKLLISVKSEGFLTLEPLLFYNKLKQTGFIYGSSTTLITNIDKSLEFTQEERCKINLLLTYYYIFKKNNTNSEFDFIESLIQYYKAFNNTKHSFFNDLFTDKNSDRLLEKMIDKRIYLDDNIFTKNFNYFLTNALLFIDVLGYLYFLKTVATNTNNVAKYIRSFESAIETIVFSVLNIKSIKTKYDTNLIKLFENSIRHKSDNLTSYKDAISLINNPLEKQYIVDLVCMASWTDKTIDKEERLFLNTLKTDLNINNNTILSSIDAINVFYKNYKNEVAFLSSKNLAQSFYDNSSKVVTKLISRNSKRLIKELTESKDAIWLLAQSTTRSLTYEEQKKIQSQLLDIFKSIPSLAIFMLPGGMLLLPLFIKFIPKLLPSAFDDNRIDNDN